MADFGMAHIGPRRHPADTRGDVLRHEGGLLDFLICHVDLPHALGRRRSIQERGLCALLGIGSGCWLLRDRGLPESTPELKKPTRPSKRDGNVTMSWHRAFLVLATGFFFVGVLPQKAHQTLKKRPSKNVSSAFITFATNDLGAMRRT